MEANQRREFRRNLEQMLKRLTDEIDRMVEAVRDEYQVPGEHDAKPSQTVDKQVHLEQNEESLVTAVHAALARIDAGTFGECEACGRAISLERLRAVPYAEYCVECQTRQEAEERAAVGRA